ncbi:MAG: glycerol-3-phosphate 1-O-acyltransferase [Lysobacterales bacterium]|nr:MAG: glycerol-3-phosphate 1-O-acyltransferase [Xanthomonadales bacterium]
MPVPEAPVFTGASITEHAGPILFIADAANAVERNLLEACLDRQLANAAPGGAADRLFLDLPTGEGGSAAGALLNKLAAPENTLPDNTLPDNTLLVPVRIAWTVPLDNEGRDGGSREPVSLRHLAFGDPRRPGRLRAWRILRKDPGRAHCIAAAPATLGELKARFAAQQKGSAERQPEDFAAFVARQAALALEIAEWGLIGRRYKVPRFIAESLRSSPKFRAAVQDLARTSGRPVEELAREADGYMKELIAVPNALFIDLRARFDKFILSLGYDKDVVCRQQDLERVREIVQTRPAMLLFTHKTYIDSVALTAKLFENDFPMLHIFAGANMGFAGLGLLMRRSGGIFIRRSFQDKPLYKLVLRHYIGYLMEKRFPMTWAFEGTRSRTGKLMPPRYGLLKYVLEAAHATDARDIHVIPVTVSYDLMRDVEEYASEQTGRVKQPESLKWFIGYVSSLRQPMGRMYLDFGEPVVLPAAPDPSDSLALSKIAFEVAVQANRVTPITMPAIGCMVLLGAAPRALTLRELQGEILRLVRWAHERGIRLTSDFSPERLGQVRDLANAMVGMGLLIRYDEGSDTVFGLDPARHPMAGYYRNTIIHHFVNKAILELALLAVAAVPDRVPADAAPADPTAAFRAETERLRDFFKFEFFYPGKAEFRGELEQEMRRVDPGWDSRLQGGPAEALALLAGMRPLVAHATLLHFVEAYSVVFDLLARLGPGEALEETECVGRALREGKQLYLQRRITSEASIGKILFGNAYKLAANLGLTRADATGNSGQADESATGQSALGQERASLLRDFKELSRRLERIRLMALSEDLDRRPRPGKVGNHATT